MNPTEPWNEYEKIIYELQKEFKKSMIDEMTLEYKKYVGLEISDAFIELANYYYDILGYLTITTIFTDTYLNLELEYDGYFIEKQHFYNYFRKACSLHCGNYFQSENYQVVKESNLRKKKP